MGIIEKRGAYFSYEGTPLGQGRENAKKFFKEHPDVMEKVAGVIRNQGVQPEPDLSEAGAVEEGLELAEE